MAKTIDLLQLENEPDHELFLHLLENGCELVYGKRNLRDDFTHEGKAITTKLSDRKVTFYGMNKDKGAALKAFYDQAVAHEDWDSKRPKGDEYKPFGATIYHPNDDMFAYYDVESKVLYVTLKPYITGWQLDKQGKVASLNERLHITMKLMPSTQEWVDDNAYSTKGMRIPSVALTGVLTGVGLQLGSWLPSDPHFKQANGR